MGNRAWMPLHIENYLADTGHLTAAEHGAYLMLIMHYWREGSLPEDEQIIARISRLSKAQWAESRPILAALFKEGWKHKRIDEELAKADDIIDKRKRAALGRHSKSKADAGAQHVQSKSTDTRVPPRTYNQDQKEEPNGSSKKRGCRLPNDFVPDAAWAVANGLDVSLYELERAKFCDYWASQPGAKGVKLDWQATWRNWVRSAVEKLAKARGSPPGRLAERRDPFKTLAEKLSNEPDRSRPSHNHDRHDAEGVPVLTIDHQRR